MPGIMRPVVCKWGEKILIQLTIILLRFILFYFPIIPHYFPVLLTFFVDIDTLEVPINCCCINILSILVTYFTKLFPDLKSQFIGQSLPEEKVWNHTEIQNQKS